MSWPAIAPGLGAPDFYVAGLAFAGFAVLVAILALTHQGERAFSPGLVYLGLGGLAAAGVAIVDAPWLTLDGDVQVVERLSELTVVVALFATGLSIDRPLSRPGWRSTIVLLAVGMPLTIAAVAALGHWGLGLSAGAAIVLGAALAPTDPVLAGDIGVGPPGEREDEPRFALTSEAGLNDGLAFPFVYLGLIVASGAGAGDVLEWLAVDVLYAVAGAVLIGALGGRSIAAVAHRLRERDLVAVELDGWAALGAAIGVYGVAELAGTYGFVAAFAGGLAFRRLASGHEYNRGVHAGAATLERVLEMAMILLLGSLITTTGLAAAGWWALALAALLLLVVRPVVAMVALAGSALSARERAFVGWFGVRGVGSVYYASAAAGAGLLAAADADRVLWTVVVVVVASIVLHGITGAPGVRALHAPARAGG